MSNHNARESVRLNPGLVFVLVVMVLCLVTGCGKQDKSEVEAAAVQVPAGGFATAQELVDFYHANCSGPREAGKPAEAAQAMENLVAVLYAENEIQEYHVRSWGRLAEMLRQEAELLGYFGDDLREYYERKYRRTEEPEEEATGTDSESWQPPRITKNDGTRAEAVDDDDEMTLHLVNVDDRWWLSTLTFESLTPITEQFVSMMEEHDSRKERVRKEILPRLRAGEFATPAAFFAEEERLMKAAKGGS